MLLKAGARMNVYDDNKKTALDHAVLLGNKDMIQLLEKKSRKS